MSEWLLILIPKEPRISKNVFIKIADIFVGFGQLCIGSIVLPYVFDKPNTKFAIQGLVLALICWIIALMLIQRYDDK